MNSIKMPRQGRLSNTEVEYLAVQEKLLRNKLKGILSSGQIDKVLAIRESVIFRTRRSAFPSPSPEEPQ